MSHFIGLMFGGDESVLYQYDENMKVKPYVRYTKKEAIEEAREQHKRRYLCVSQNLGRNPLHWDDWMKNVAAIGQNMTDEQAWEQAKDWGYEIDKDDNLLSTYNPDSKWDWYQVGGRWGGYLPLKESQTVTFEGENYEFTYTDECVVKEVDWDTYFREHTSPFCFITTTGEWHEKAEMGWWAMTANDKEENDWIKEFKDYLNILDPDTVITAIDFHI